MIDAARITPSLCDASPAPSAASRSPCDVEPVTAEAARLETLSTGATASDAANAANAGSRGTGDAANAGSRGAGAAVDAPRRNSALKPVEIDPEGRRRGRPPGPAKPEKPKAPKKDTRDLVAEVIDPKVDPRIIADVRRSILEAAARVGARVRANDPSVSEQDLVAYFEAFGASPYREERIALLSLVGRCVPMKVTGDTEAPIEIVVRHEPKPIN